MILYYRTTVSYTQFLNVLAFQASSVLCECLFSTSKQVADDCHAHLGPCKFEELQGMKFMWCKNVDDLVELNSEEIEGVVWVCIMRY